MDSKHVLTITTVPASEITGADNEQGKELTIQDLLLPRVQGVDNEQGREQSMGIITMPIAQPVANEPKKKAMFSLDGRLITAEDPLTIGHNYRELANVRYGDLHPVSVAGISKINSTTALMWPKVRNAFHFNKIQPAETTTTESHVLVHAYDAAMSETMVIQNDTAIPGTGDFDDSLTTVGSNLITNGTDWTGAS